MLFGPVSSICAASGYPLSASDVAIQDALDYLREKQSPDGAIGSFADSAFVCMAIAAAGEDPNEWSNGGETLVEYLKAGLPSASEELNMCTFLARMVLAAVAAGESPSRFGAWSGSNLEVTVSSGNYLEALVSLHNGTQFLQDLTGESDSAHALNDDSWALRALIAAGEPLRSSLVQSTVQFIIDNQEADGGWTWCSTSHSRYVAGSADVDNTAAALVALCLAGEDGQVVQDGLEFMRSEQDSSGGFSNSWTRVNVQSTAWAVDAITASGKDPTGNSWKVPEDPIDYLLANQRSDGSFGDGIRATADTIAALVGVNDQESAGPDVEADGPALSCSPSSITFDAVEGDYNPGSQTLKVWNSGGGRLNWKVSANKDWISVSPRSDSSSGEKDSVTVSIDISGLSAGSYVGEITVADEDDRDGREYIKVTLFVSESETREEEGRGQEPDSHILAVTVTPDGAGSVSRSVAAGPSGYEDGSTVTLTAAANEGYAFIGWAGDAGGSQPSTTVVMNNHRSVVARFLPFEASGLTDVTLAYVPPEITSLTVMPYPVDSIPSNPPGFIIDSAVLVRPEGAGTFTLEFGGIVNPDYVGIFQVENGAWAQVPRSVAGDNALQVSLPMAETVLAFASPGTSTGQLWKRATGFCDCLGSTALILIAVACVVAVIVILLLVSFLRRESY